MSRMSRTPAQILAEIAREARKRDTAAPKVQAANEKLRVLWNEARELGVDSKTIAERSGVKSVTVRLYWDPTKAGQRAKARNGKPRKKSAAKVK